MVDDKLLAEQLLALLKEGEDSERIDACFTLAELRICQATELIPYLQDVNYRIRQYTARALGELGDPKAIAPLLQVLDDPHWQVRGYAVIALRKLSNCSILDQVVQAVQGESHEFVILCVLDWISQLEHPSKRQRQFARAIAENPIYSEYLRGRAKLAST